MKLTCFVIIKRFYGTQTGSSLELIHMNCFCHYYCYPSRNSNTFREADRQFSFYTFCVCFCTKCEHATMCGKLLCSDKFVCGSVNIKLLLFPSTPTLITSLNNQRISVNGISYLATMLECFIYPAIAQISIS